MTHLSPSELAELRRALVHERDELRATLAARARDSRGIAAEENDEVDIANRIVEQEDALRVSGFDRGLLADVEHALAKLDAGTYGTSEDSGDPIDIGRLRAMPWARRTLDEEEALARGR